MNIQFANKGKSTARILSLGGLVFGLSVCALAQWPARYNDALNLEDQVSAITTDTGGNVFVCGSTQTATRQDFITIKYNAAGVKQWSRTAAGVGNGYSVATAIATDGSGNVYVTGASRGNVNDDYLTLKYDSKGNIQWKKRYNGPADKHDYPNAMKLDSEANVYVTGFFGTATGRDYGTLKYDTNGNLQWAKTYDGPGHGYDEATCLVVDPNENVTVSGSSDGTSNADIFTIQYAPSGAKNWSARFNGPGHHEDRANAIALDSSGNVIVVGSTYDTSYSQQYITVKYTSGGANVWNRNYGPSNSEDYASAVAVDANDNIFVTGTSGTDYELLNIVTIKYSPTGTKLWVRTYTGNHETGGSTDFGKSVLIGPSGDVYVGGNEQGDGVDFDYNFCVLHYSNAGVLLGTQFYSGDPHVDDIFIGMAMDTSGNLYYTGNTYGQTSHTDIVTSKS